MGVLQILYPSCTLIWVIRYHPASRLVHVYVPSLPVYRVPKSIYRPAVTRSSFTPTFERVFVVWRASLAITVIEVVPLSPGRSSSSLPETAKAAVGSIPTIMMTAIRPASHLLNCFFMLLITSCLMPAEAGVSQGQNGYWPGGLADSKMKAFASAVNASSSAARSKNSLFGTGSAVLRTA